MENPIWSCFFRPPREKNDMLELLRALPVFEGLSKNELLILERMLHVRRYSAGEMVFDEGVPGAGMYIVREGEIVIKKRVEGHDPVVLADIKDHSFFGEMALLEEMPRSAAAYAVKESVLLALGKPDLEAIIERNPRLGLTIINNIAGLVCKRLVRANDNLEQLQQRISQLTGGQT